MDTNSKFPYTMPTEAIETQPDALPFRELPVTAPSQQVIAEPAITGQPIAPVPTMHGAEGSVLGSQGFRELPIQIEAQQKVGWQPETLLPTAQPPTTNATDSSPLSHEGGEYYSTGE